MKRPKRIPYLAERIVWFNRSTWLERLFSFRAWWEYLDK